MKRRLMRLLLSAACLSLLAASLAMLAAFLWLRLANGWGVAGVFLDGLAASPDVRVPFRLAPLPAFVAFLVSFILVMSGTTFSPWRAAVTPPAVAMR